MTIRAREQVRAVQVTAQNMEYAEAFCEGRGGIKGTRLPPEDRIVQLYGGGGGRLECPEQDARVGDWIVRHALGDYEVLSNERFEARYTEHLYHSDDSAVDRFAEAMKVKLARKRAEGRGGWDQVDCTQEMLSRMLRDHVEKGDPVDVGNLAMMLQQRGEGIL